jgi:hypothetical protein
MIWTWVEPDDADPRCAGDCSGAAVGKAYDPSTGSARHLASTEALALNHYPSKSFVWTGSEVIVWGGTLSPPVNCIASDEWPCSPPPAAPLGLRYHIESDTWRPMSEQGAPSRRSGHHAVWTGTEMIIWGGAAGERDFFRDGARYDPVTDSWTPMSADGAPAPGNGTKRALWTGEEMILWGGWDGDGGDARSAGARYDPATDTWTHMAEDGAPRDGGGAVVWTGEEMLVWGGYLREDRRAERVYLDAGFRYRP